MLSDPLTQAGRIAAEHASLWAQRIPDANLETVAKPSRSRVRQAREQSAVGMRFLGDGKHALAIDRLKRSIELDPTVAAVQHDLGLAYFAAGRLEPAFDALRRAISLDPELGRAHLKLASILDFVGQETEAQAAYEAGVRLEPSEHWALARLAQIHLANARHPEAEAAFRAAAAAAGSPHSGLYHARAMLIAGRRAEAETVVQAVIATDPDCGEAHVILGQIQAEYGRSDAAAASFERGIMLDPGMAAAWSNLAVNRKFRASDQVLFEQMNACLERRDLMPWQRQAVLFALGKAHDDVGDYAAAMRHFDAANRLRGAQVRFDGERLARHTSHVIASTPPGFLRRRSNPGVVDATPILIVGMPRSGTTLVEQILSSHPNVAAGGELSFWGRLSQAGPGVFDATADAGTVQRLAGDYLGVLRAVAPDATRVTDKMPFNFFLLGVIRQALPHATIVHCRRHPIDTCLSIYVTDFQTRYDFASDRGALVFVYREYLRMMAHWRSVLPSDHCIEVDYETLVSDPESITRRLVAACGLEWSDACLAPDRNRRAITTASLWQARQPIYGTSVERWRRYEPWLGELRELLTVDSGANGA